MTTSASEIAQLMGIVIGLSTGLLALVFFMEFVIGKCVLRINRSLARRHINIKKKCSSPFCCIPSDPVVVLSHLFIVLQPFVFIIGINISLLVVYISLPGVDYDWPIITLLLVLTNFVFRKSISRRVDGLYRFLCPPYDYGTFLVIQGQASGFLVFQNDEFIRLVKTILVDGQEVVVESHVAISILMKKVTKTMHFPGSGPVLTQDQVNFLEANGVLS